VALPVPVRHRDSNIDTAARDAVLTSATRPTSEVRRIQYESLGATIHVGDLFLALTGNASRQQYRRRRALVRSFRMTLRKLVAAEFRGNAHIETLPNATQIMTVH
jgi:hypothetical protein